MAKRKPVCSVAEIVLLVIFIILFLTLLLITLLIIFITPDKDPIFHAYPVVITSGGKANYIRRFEKCVCKGHVNATSRRYRRQVPYKPGNGPEFLAYDRSNGGSASIGVESPKPQEVRQTLKQLSRCTVLPDLRKLNDSAPDANETALRIKQFPFLVSLSELTYFDSQKDRRFACSGVVLSESWIMSAEACVQADTEWGGILVRAGSDYWSVGGTEHIVVRVIRLEDELRGPVGLRIFPFLVMTDAVQPLGITLPQENSTWTEAVSPGWTRALSNDPTERRKYEKFTVSQWTRTFCERCPIGTYDGKAQCDDSNPGRPLVAGNSLIGIQTGVGCRKVERFSRRTSPKEHFERMQVREMQEWIDNMVDNLVNDTVYKFDREVASVKRIVETIYETNDNAQDVTLHYVPEHTLASSVPVITDDETVADENGKIGIATLAHILPMGVATVADESGLMGAAVA